MLYTGYQGFSDAMMPLRMAARAALWCRDQLGPFADLPLTRRAFAIAETLDSAQMTRSEEHTSELQSH